MNLIALLESLDADKEASAKRTFTTLEKCILHVDHSYLYANPELLEIKSL